MSQRRAFSRALKNRDQGLSLMEMVVTLGIITMVMLAAGGAFIRSTQSQRVAEATDRATQLANDSIESFRRVPWSKVGFYTGQPGLRECEVASAACVHREKTVRLTGAPPAAGPGVFIPEPKRVDSRAGQDFTIRTDITWAKTAFDNAGVDTNDNAGGLQHTPEPYAPKRIRVEVEYTLGANNGTRVRKIVSETIRAASAAEVIPPAVGEGTGSGCALAAPFCVVYATQGQVLKRVGSDYQTSRPIQFYVSTTRNATAAAVSYRTSSGVVREPMLGSGTTWSTVLPNNKPNMRPGTHDVQFHVTFGAAGEQTKTMNVAWHVPVPSPLTVNLVQFGGRRVAAGLVTPRDHLCVRHDNGTLWNEGPTRILVSVANTNDQDASPRQPPMISWTAPYIGPLAMTPAGIISGAPGAFSGGTNYYYDWQPPKLFNRTSTTVTVTATRPADGQQATMTLTLPVRFAKSVGECNGGAPSYAPPAFATAKTE